MFDHDKGRSAIIEKLHGVSFSSTKKERLGVIIGLSVFGLGVIFAFWGFITSDLISPQFIVGIVFGLIGIGILIYFEVHAKRIINKNLQTIKKYEYDLHQIYFDAAIQEKYRGLTIKNFQNGNGYNIADLVIDFNGQDILWNVDEDIETRTKTVIDSKGRTKTVTYKVYILKSYLANQISEIKGLDPINITQGDATKLLSRSKYWQSESIEFNQHYRVSYIDEFGMVKLFSPKIIDNFNKSENQFDGRTIHLQDGVCSIKWRSTTENLLTTNPKFLDWNGLNWKENHYQKIAEKIELDFTRFEKNQILLEPFEFGKVQKMV